jgi:putative sterol carrier protein
MIKKVNDAGEGRMRIYHRIAGLSRLPQTSTPEGASHCKNGFFSDIHGIRFFNPREKGEVQESTNLEMNRSRELFMVNASELLKALQKWADVVNKPEISEQFDGYNKTMQLVFPDVKVNLKLVIKNKTARIEEGLDKNADMSLEISSTMFMGIIDGSVDPMEAFMTGELKPVGDMADLEKLQVLIDGK